MSVPNITFRVDLSIATVEGDGTKTSPLSYAVLHPDRFTGVEGQDKVLANIAFRSSQREVYLPGVTAGMNRKLRHGDVFSESGLNAQYLKNTYGVGHAEDKDNQFLVVVSDDSAGA